MSLITTLTMLTKFRLDERTCFKKKRRINFPEKKSHFQKLFRLLGDSFVKYQQSSKVMRPSMRLRLRMGAHVITEQRVSGAHRGRLARHKTVFTVVVVVFYRNIASKRICPFVNF